jgi:ATP-dependent DNA ligase
VAFKTNGKVHFRSRNGKDFSAKYPAIAKALAPMPDETVIGGEIVALNDAGRASFNALQNHRAVTGQVFFYVFDIMVAAGEDLMALPWRHGGRSCDAMSCPGLLIQFANPQCWRPACRI